MKDPLFGNKVAAAVLVTLLLAVGLPVVFNTMSQLAGGHHGDHHDADPENPFGLVHIPAEITTGPAAAVEEPEIDLGTLLAGADATRGARAAAVCTACHTFEEGGTNGTGPNLWDIIDRPLAGSPGFGYSQAVRDAGGVWSYDRLDSYLENSAGYISGTTMAQRIRNEGRRADILAYLQTLSSNPVSFPEPAPVMMDDVEAAADADHGGDH